MIHVQAPRFLFNGGLLPAILAVSLLHAGNVEGSAARRPRPKAGCRMGGLAAGAMLAAAHFARGAAAMAEGPALPAVSHDSLARGSSTLGGSRLPGFPQAPVQPLAGAALEPWGSFEAWAPAIDPSAPMGSFDLQGFNGALASQHQVLEDLVKSSGQGLDGILQRIPGFQDAEMERVLEVIGNSYAQAMKAISWSQGEGSTPLKVSAREEALGVISTLMRQLAADSVLAKELLKQQLLGRIASIELLGRRGELDAIRSRHARPFTRDTADREAALARALEADAARLLVVNAMTLHLQAWKWRLEAVMRELLASCHRAAAAGRVYREERISNAAS